MAHKFDRAALAEKVRNIEGITPEDKATLLELINDEKKFGIVWEDKPEDVQEQLRMQIPVLREVISRRLNSNNKTAPNHILIEGDNLHALTALSYTHEGRIDIIYIDPPYNTGHKDFKYNDNFVDKDDSYKHSKWLSFMSKRLILAKNLLSEDGAIFISIDENELYPLKVLCDDIFGDSNFLGQWNWYKSATPPALSLKQKRNVEYILGYEKKRSSIKYQGVQKISLSNDPIIKPQNSIKTLVFPKNTFKVALKDQIVSAGVYGTQKYPNILLNDMIVKNGTNANEVSFKNRFIWLQEKLNEELMKGTSFFLSKQLVISYKKENYSPEVPPNFIDMSVGVNTNEEAGKQLNNILIQNDFEYPKPVSLIKYLLSFKPCPIILDFFAGSGTTLHATMKLNAEDGGNRQCILVTNNENNICENITYERNKRVIQGYTTPKGEHIDGLDNNNLFYYQIDMLDRDQTDENKQKLMNSSTDLICIKENIFAEKDVFLGLKLPRQIVRYFEDNGKSMLIIYNSSVIPFIVKAISTGKKLVGKLQVYIMCDGQYPYTSDFESVLDKVDLHAMPHSLFQAYRHVLPSKSAEKDYNNLPEISEDELNEVDGTIYKAEDYD